MIIVINNHSLIMLTPIAIGVKFPIFIPWHQVTMISIVISGKNLLTAQPMYIVLNGYWYRVVSRLLKWYWNRYRDIQVFLAHH